MIFHFQYFACSVEVMSQGVGEVIEINVTINNLRVGF